jgi:hypothetical protein
LIVGRDLKGRKKEWWHQDKFLKPWTIKQTSLRIEIILQSHIERMRRDINFKVNNNLGFSAMFQFGPRNSIISTSWHHTLTRQGSWQIKLWRILKKQTENGLELSLGINLTNQSFFRGFKLFFIHVETPMTTSNTFRDILFEHLLQYFKEEKIMKKEKKTISFVEVGKY